MANLFEALKDSMDSFRIRIKGNPSKRDDILVNNDKSLGKEILDNDSVNGSNIIDTSELNKFRTLGNDREEQYRMYDEMENDSIISTALQMYADDATQYNNKGKIIWAESDDTDVASFANRLIDVLGINENAWSHIYSMCKYGDLYIETFKDDEIDDDPLLSREVDSAPELVVKDHPVGAQLEEYIEQVPNPAELFDITKRGKTVGFIRVKVDATDSEDMKYAWQMPSIDIDENRTTILPPDKYVHICIAPNTERYPEKLNIFFDNSYDDNVDSKKYQYNIKRGKSILHDVFRSYRELSLMEDAILLNRVTRSSILRILQVEIGDMPKSQARETLKRLKTLIEQKNFMDKNEGYYSSQSSPGPMDNIIYVPTTNGKGNITASNIGGDADIKSIIDIDYYQAKLAGGLKIPISFLTGHSEDGGLSAGTALTKLDSRYARTVKRIQNAYISGITTLINIFAISKNLTDHINNFTIKMVSPSSVEDTERNEQMETNMSIIENFMSIISDEMFSTDARKEVLLNLITNLMNEPEIVDILEKDDIEHEESEGLGDTGDFDGDMDLGVGSDEGEFTTDFSGIDNEEDFSEEDFSKEEGDIGEESSEEFGDFENEF